MFLHKKKKGHFPVFQFLRVIEIDALHAQVPGFGFAVVRLGDSGWPRTSAQGAKFLQEKHRVRCEDGPWEVSRKVGLMGREAPQRGLCEANIQASIIINRGLSLLAQSVKNLPARQETWVRFPGWEEHLEEEMPTHSSILAWRILWTEDSP